MEDIKENAREKENWRILNSVLGRIWTLYTLNLFFHSLANKSKWIKMIQRGYLQLSYQKTPKTAKFAEGSNPLFIKKSHYYWLSTRFRNSVNRPSTNFRPSQPFCNCTQIHYFNLYKTLLWPSNEGYWGVVVLSIRQDQDK